MRGSCQRVDFALRLGRRLSPSTAGKVGTLVGEYAAGDSLEFPSSRVRGYGADTGARLGPSDAAGLAGQEYLLDSRAAWIVVLLGRDPDDAGDALGCGGSSFRPLRKLHALPRSLPHSC